MTGSILGKTRYGVISKSREGSLLWYFLLLKMKYVLNRVGLCTEGPEILIFQKTGWGKWVYPNYHLPNFSKFSNYFFIFFSTEYVRDEQRGCCCEATFSNIHHGGHQAPTKFSKFEKVAFSNIYRPKTVQARMIWIMIRVEGQVAIKLWANDDSRTFRRFYRIFRAIFFTEFFCHHKFTKSTRPFFDGKKSAPIIQGMVQGVLGGGENPFSPHDFFIFFIFSYQNLKVE